MSLCYGGKEGGEAGEQSERVVDREGFDWNHALEDAVSENGV